VRGNGINNARQAVDQRGLKTLAPWLFKAFSGSMINLSDQLVQVLRQSDGFLRDHHH